MTTILNDKSKGALALFGSALIYASFGILVREMAKMYGAYSQVAARFILAFIIIFILNKLLHKELKISKQEFLRVFVLGCIFITAVIFFTLSVTETKIANTVLDVFVT